MHSGPISRAARLRARFVTVLAVIISFGAGPAMAAKYYVDHRLGDLKPEQVVTVTDPKPTQFLLEFQTDGVANAKATKVVKPLAATAITERHVFTELAEQPVPSKSLLTIVFNNVTEKGAAGKGFKTGLTFGLAALQIADRYQVHFELLQGPGVAPITCDIEHAFIMTMGKKEDPSIGIPVKNTDVGIKMIINQVMAHGVNCLAGKMTPTAAPAGQ
ncbi:MAG: hypothetical protein V4564_04000 [Pseudomonadota bacterium]